MPSRARSTSKKGLQGMAASLVVARAADVPADIVRVVGTGKTEEQHWTWLKHNVLWQVLALVEPDMTMGMAFCTRAAADMIEAVLEPIYAARATVDPQAWAALLKWGPTGWAFVLVSYFCYQIGAGDDKTKLQCSFDKSKFNFVYIYKHLKREKASLGTYTFQLPWEKYSGAGIRTPEVTTLKGMFNTDKPGSSSKAYRDRVSILSHLLEQTGNLPICTAIYEYACPDFSIPKDPTTGKELYKGIGKIGAAMRSVIAKYDKAAGKRDQTAADKLAEEVARGIFGATASIKKMGLGLPSRKRAVDLREMEKHDELLRAAGYALHSIPVWMQQDVIDGAIHDDAADAAAKEATLSDREAVGW